MIPIPHAQCYRPRMARLARIVIPGLPHHVTQRGNRREAIFFEDGDHEIYLDLLAEQTSKAGVAVWAYCLMPNHVHLILKPGAPMTWAAPSAKPTGVTPISSTPADAGPATCFRAALLRWCWTTHLIRAVRYVSLNPVRARLVARAEEWKWSSVRAHLAGVDDALVTVRPVLDRIPHFKALLEADAEEDFSELRRAETTGRPLGAPEFVTGLEKILGRKIARRAPGRKATGEDPDPDQLRLL